MQHDLVNHYSRGKSLAGCTVISVCNHKGGVAKTSTCHNLGYALMKMDKRVLLIDFDVQANLSMLLGCGQSKSFFDLMDSSDNDVSKYVVKTSNGLWLLPSNEKMSLAARQYLATSGFEYLLRDKLESIKQLFDFILIDTPASGDFFTLNALMSSEKALIPTQCEYLAMNGVQHTVGMIDAIRQRTGHVVDYRILITFDDEGNVAADVIKTKLKKSYPGKIFETTISRDSNVQESQILRLAVMDYNANNHVGRQYMEVARNVLAG